MRLRGTVISGAVCPGLRAFARPYQWNLTTANRYTRGRASIRADGGWP